MSVLASQLRSAGAYVAPGVRDHERVAYGTREVARRRALVLPTKRRARVKGRRQ